MASGIPAGAVFVDVLPSFDGFPNALRNGLVGPAGNAGGDAGNAAGDGLSDGLLGKVKKLAGPLLAAFAGFKIGEFLVGSITDAIDQGRITDRLSAQLGLTQEESKRVGGAAGNLYAGAYGESMEEVADGLKGIIGSGLVDPTATQKDIEAVGAQVFNLSSAFGEDTSRIAASAEQLLRNGLVGSAEEAFDVLTVGFQNGTNKAEDLLDTFDEYSTIFRSLGIDGATATGLLSQGLQAGARDADTVADALKEFQIRATDASTGSAAGFEALGLSAEEMTAQIAQGGEGASAGLQTVLDRLKAMDDPVARNAAAVALFGTKAEDLGTALFALDPSSAVASLGEVAGASDRLGETLNDNAATNIETFKRSFSQAFVNVLGGVVLPIVERFAGFLGGTVGPILADTTGAVSAFISAFKAGDGDVTSSGIPGVFERIGGAARTAWDAAVGFAGAVSDFVEENRTGLTIIAGAVGGAVIAFGALQAVQLALIGLRYGVFLAQYALQVGVVSAATKAWAIVQAGLNLVMSANPITLVVLAIGALVGIFLVLWNTNAGFREFVLGVWDAIKSGIGAAVSFITDTVLPGLMAGVDAVASGLSWFYENVVQPVWGFIASAVEFYVGLVVGYVQLWIDIVQAVGSGLEWFYDNIVSPVFQLIGAAVSYAWTNVILPVFQFLQDWLVDKLRIAFTVYRDLAIGAWNLVRDGISAAWGFIRDNVLNPLIRFYEGTLQPAFTKLKDVATDAWGLLRDGVNAVWTFLRDNVFSPLGTFLSVTIPGWFTKGKDDAGAAWGLLQGLVEGPVKFIRETVLAPLQEFLTVTVVGWFRTAKDWIGDEWAKLQDLAKAPVRFIIDTVLNDGIVGTFNSLADFFGTKRLPEIPLPKGFATGGSIRGAGSGTSDSIPAWLSNGEYVVKASSVRKLGTGFLDYLNAGQYASGGLIGAVTDPVGKMKAGISNLLDAVPGGGAFRDIALGLPKKVLELAVAKVKSLAEGLFGGGGGGDLGSGTGTGGWQWQMRVLRAVFPGLPLNSGYRPGAITATGNSSYHSKGRAVDVPPRTDVFNWIRNTYGANTKELIFSPMGAAQLRNGQSHVYSGVTKAMHYNHVHWAYRNGGLVNANPLTYDSGGYLPPGLSTVYNGTGVPEPVFTSAQAAALADRSSSSLELLARLDRLADLTQAATEGNLDSLGAVLQAVNAQPRRTQQLSRQGGR